MTPGVTETKGLNAELRRLKTILVSALVGDGVERDRQQRFVLEVFRHPIFAGTSLGPGANLSWVSVRDLAHEVRTILETLQECPKSVTPEARAQLEVFLEAVRDTSQFH